jgi:short-subunit dehydrogenase
VIGLVGGAVVLNASVVPVQGVPNFCVYSASKVAISSFAPRLNERSKRFQIGVNVLSPGPTRRYSAAWYRITEGYCVLDQHLEDVGAK